jgi:putative Mn2+ efflux pump MntP
MVDGLHWLEILGISVGLAMDAFAVAVAAGLAIGRVTPRQTFRLAFHFGLFQFLMPILGWLAGQQLASCVQPYDHWIAFGLLSFVGGKMLVEALRGEHSQSRSDPTRGLTLVTLSVATSIDALAVGLSMAFLQVSVWVPAAVIGLVTAAITTAGIGFGGLLGPRWGNRAEAVGGGVLLLIGLKILADHLLA